MTWADAIGAIIAAGIGMASSATSSAMSYDQTKELQQRQFNYQERMADTAHQREMKDLRNAGLNPILTATGGQGATTPSGASGQGSNVNLGEGMMNAISTAIQAKKAGSETNLMDEQAKTEETKRENFEANTAIERLKAVGQQIDNMNLPEKYKREFQEMASRTTLNYASADAKQVEMLTNKMNAESKRMEAKANAKYTNERSRGYSESYSSEASGTRGIMGISAGQKSGSSYSRTY